MSVQTKKRFKNLSKILGVALFALLMFTNIKVALMDDAEIASGDISILGVEIELFDAAYANTRSSETGQWVTYSGTSGTLSDWWCDPGGSECIVGQTGSGYIP